MTKTKKLSLLSLWTVSAQQVPLPVPVQTIPHKTRNLSLLPAQTVSAKQGPLPGQVAVWRHRTVTPNPGLLNPDSVMKTLRSAGALEHKFLNNFLSCTVYSEWFCHIN